MSNFKKPSEKGGLQRGPGKALGPDVEAQKKVLKRSIAPSIELLGKAPIVGPMSERPGRRGAGMKDAIGRGFGRALGQSAGRALGQGVGRALGQGAGRQMGRLNLDANTLPCAVKAKSTFVSPFGSSQMESKSNKSDRKKDLVKKYLRKKASVKPTATSKSINQN